MATIKHPETTIAGLQKHLARVVVVAPDVHKQYPSGQAKEVLLLRRPGWAKTGSRQLALPGGKITVAEDDLRHLTVEQLKNNDFILNTEQLLVGALQAAIRELGEELDLVLAADLLRYVGSSDNSLGWVTHSFLAKLTAKPTITVKPEIAGAEWVDQDRILGEKPRLNLLSGHLAIARKALQGQ